MGGVTAQTNGAAIRSGLDLSHVDAKARPQDDLFGHVNGRWLTDYVIPADRATDGAFRSLFDRAEEQVRDLITEAAAEASLADAGGATDLQRIGDLYASFMDEATVQRRGVQPLLDELALIDGAGDADALAAVVGGLQRTGVGGGVGALRRHRFEELVALPGARQPVRYRVARRVVLPRPSARRDPGGLSRPYRADVRARRTAAHPRSTHTPLPASSRWKPNWPRHIGMWSSAATPT